MNIWTNSIVMALRRFGRKFRLNQMIGALVFNKEYEKNYESSLVQTIKPSDCIWDVGANIGYYTNIFSTIVGKAGKVYSFEPSPINFSQLVKRCAPLKNVAFLECGLGASQTTLYLKQGLDECGATSIITTNESQGNPVKIRSGDELIRQGNVSIPQVIKIDVEGFEGEVLSGIERLLSNPSLRSIGIEMHFGILEERNKAQIPKEIEMKLQSKGFSVSWPDCSHLLAVR